MFPLKSSNTMTRQLGSIALGFVSAHPARVAGGRPQAAPRRIIWGLADARPQAHLANWELLNLRRVILIAALTVLAAVTPQLHGQKLDDMSLDRWEKLRAKRRRWFRRSLDFRGRPGPTFLISIWQFRADEAVRSGDRNAVNG